MKTFKCKTQLYRLAMHIWLIASSLLLSLIGFAQEQFIIEVEPISIPNMPGVQSFAWGKASDGKILIIGGRRDGLHLRRPFETFDPAQSNKDLIVLDINAKRIWTAPLNSLPTSIQEQLQSTNMQFYQRDSILYIIGGYGYSATAGDHITFPNLTAIHVDSVVDAIINNKPFAKFFRQIEDSRMQVTGGQLGYLDSFFYLCGGQKFMGRYNPMGGPSFSQEYTEEIRKFKIVDNGTTLTIQDYSAIKDMANLHRRDYNMSPQIFPDGSHGFTMFTGVFQFTANLPFLNSVNVFDTGYQVVNQNIYLSHYHSAKVPIWDSTANKMHTIFFGGIAQFYMDSLGNLIRDDSVPFVTTISKVTRHSDWTLSEYKIGDMPGLVGASSEFVPVSSPDVKYIKGEILHLNKVPDNKRVLIGYIIGGINSSEPNIFWINDGTQSKADPTVYAVYLKKGESRDIEVKYIEPPEEIKLTINPNPVEDILNAEIQLPEGEGFFVRIVNMKGETVYFQQIPMVIGVFRLAIDVKDLSQGAYIFEVGSKGSGRKSIAFVKI